MLGFAVRGLFGPFAEKNMGIIWSNINIHKTIAAEVEKGGR